MKKKRRRTAAPMPEWYCPFKLQLPYCQGVLSQANLISPDANAVTVMRVMARLIRVPVIAKRRDAGLTVEDILQTLSARTMQRIRKRVRVKR